MDEGGGGAGHFPIVRWQWSEVRQPLTAAACVLLAVVAKTGK